MILNHQHKFLFIHVPKTAGQSISRYFPRVKDHWPLHTPRFAVDTDYFSFGFTRNPWDRIVSQYFFVCQKCQNSKEHWNQQAIRDMGFIRWLFEDDMTHWSDERFGSPPRFQERDQSWWLDGCDYVGNYERMEDDLQAIRHLIGTNDNQLSHMNASKHGDYRAYYTPEAVDFVAEHHKKTIDQMRYDFENLYRI